MRLRIFTLLICCFGSATFSFGQIDFEEHIVIDDRNILIRSYAVHSSDIDNDGDLDVIASSSSKVVWYENLDGLGRFGDQQVVNDSTYLAREVLAIDLDQDGDQDIVFSDDDKIAWHENLDGAGGFGQEQIIADSLRSVYSISFQIADLDGDGDLDIAHNGSDDPELQWLENVDGQQNFTITHQVYNNTFYIRAVHAVDLDDDGDIDLISASPDDRKIAWYENTDGLGNFSDQQVISTNAYYASTVFSADLDADGDLDIVSGSEYDSKVAWYENTDGQGAFSEENIITEEAPNVQSVYCKDIDNDGDIDVLSASNELIAWYENTDGQGTFGVQKVINNEVYKPYKVFAADIDGDGDNDVLSASGDDDKIAWYKNEDGQGSLVVQQFISYGANYPREVQSADVDGDGDLDLLSASWHDDKIAWYENTDGKGSFGFQQVITNKAQFAKSLAAADLDNDGDLDVVSASDDDHKIAWYENLDGLGNFGPQQVITIKAKNATFVRVADLDNDNDLDIVYACNSGLYPDIVWYENIDGLGTFESGGVLIGDANGVTSLFIADIDSDGDMDVLSSSLADDKLAWYENTNGQGAFGGQQVISSNVNRAEFVYVADLDGDLDLDIVLAYNYREIAWYENEDGLANFSEAKIIKDSGEYVNTIYLSDLDGDADLDLIASGWRDDKITWYEHLDGKGNFGVEQIISTSTPNAQFVHSSDLDNDGDFDIVSCSGGDHKIAWYENLRISSNDIRGLIQFDTYLNNCDSSNLPIPGVLVASTDGTETLATLSLANGYYQLFPDEGSYTTAANFNLPNYFSIDPPFSVSNFIGIGNTDTLNFCVVPTMNVNDLNVVLWPTSEARPGFDASYQIAYQNVGTTRLSGKITLEYDASKMTWLSASEMISEQTGNTISFEYDTLNLFEQRTIDLEFNILPPPTTNIDEELVFTTTIDPVAGDFTEEDNQFLLEQLIIGSYDPNDIAVLEGDEIKLEQVDNYLHYLIRFQNTGTASAINVRVENELDPNLDWSTLQVESVSHPNRVEIVDENKVLFIFDQINLPDSTTNEPASNGFIAYKIKPRANLGVNDKMSNKADIYFDFNEAIRTNTVTTTIIAPNQANNLNLLEFSLYPNPINNILSIISSRKIRGIEVYSPVGQLLLKTIGQNQVDFSTLPSGFYLCKVIDEDGNTGLKKVIKR